ncbi:hypothetical protein [Marinobacter salicampi]|uniref:hypothetical protein n=1 Tax=Marinobacter salicampi TaxID=435907 RepID=UPI001408CD90|nr:hypothetical protein [Marinobacter salicampi]
MKTFMKMIGALAFLFGVVVVSVVGALALAAGFGVTLDVGSVFNMGGLVLVVGGATIVVRAILKKAKSVSLRGNLNFRAPKIQLSSVKGDEHHCKGFAPNPEWRFHTKNSIFDD